MVIKVVLADDHAVVCDGVKALLQTQPEIQVVGSANGGRQAIALAHKLRPDVMVMDIGMPELNGVDAAIQIRRQLPATQIVILSVHKTSEHVFRALKAGALGYVVKESAGLEVALAVRAVHQGKRYLSERIGDMVAAEFVRLRDVAEWLSPLDSLSEREREVLQLVVEGHSNAAVAAHLKLSVKTVETYRSRLMEKLRVQDFSGLVKFALAHGITTEY
jgi:DNA-binding NarL/FixJ family response regulator